MCKLVTCFAPIPRPNYVEPTTTTVYTPCNPKRNWLTLILVHLQAFCVQLVDIDPELKNYLKQMMIKQKGNRCWVMERF